MSAECEPCKRAEIKPTVGMYMHSCRNCQSRRLAVSTEAAKALAGDPTELQASIAELWKEDYDAGRAAVFDWMKRIKAWTASQGESK